jgi:hypothetical protein
MGKIRVSACKIWPCHTLKYVSNQKYRKALTGFIGHGPVVSPVNIKVKVPRNRLESPEGGRGIALHSLDLGARRVGWPAPRPGRFITGKEPVPIVQEAGWAPGPVLTYAKNHASTGVRSPDRLARSPVAIPTELSRPPCEHGD